MIIEANEAILTMFGYEEHEAIGKSALGFVASEYRDQAQRNLLLGYEEPYEIVSVKKDGIHFDLEVRGKTSLYRGRAVRVTAVRDVTERKKAER